MAAILHKVKKSDSIMAICLLYGLNYDQLHKLNQKFLGLGEYETLHLYPGAFLVVGDSADPLDLVRVLSRRGKL